MNAETQQEASRLYQAWVVALAVYMNDDTTANNRAEQAAYDELVDFVEANDLNLSEYDPRTSSTTTTGEQ